MKLETLSGIKLFVVALSLFIFANMGELIAQTNSINDLTSNQYALENLLEGIQSDNDGVKRSSIYYTGKYRIAQAEQVLLDQLKNEDNASDRILIAMVLYELGSEEGLLAVKNLAKSDIDIKVKRMSTHIYSEYLAKDISAEISLDDLY